jgi:hypothetical protein
MILGLAGMGFLAVSRKALGGLSFAPLLLAISLVGYLVSVGLDVSNFALGQAAKDLMDVVTIGCWLLLGIALWSAREPAADPAVPA